MSPAVQYPGRTDGAAASPKAFSRAGGLKVPIEISGLSLSGDQLAGQRHSWDMILDQLILRDSVYAQ
eukprot:COSAG02_NODE_5104_length_4627_cov_3.621466_8_plen_66_part_01